MKLPLLLVSALLAALVTPPALAEETAPDALVKGISEEVIATIRQDKDIQAGDPRKIAELVEAKILPHFALLVRTYSGALAGYSDQVIEFRPLRAQPGDTEVTVHSQVRRSGAEPIAIEYDLERTGLAWKVFDIRVAGISLAATYRSAFAEEVRNHGIDGLISLLSSKNRAAVKPVSVKT